jgi:uncharacterized metal-binding protein
MTPDLDQEGLCTGESLIVKWTLGIGFLWCAIWYPYATMFSHRSFYTHFPIVSTLIRILYLFVPTFIILHLLGYNIHIPWIYALFGFIGLVISDTAHWAMDRF